jgi:SAM-dependent methyltransferase
MADYALLIQPSANRVYTEASTELVLGELAVLDEGPLGGILEGSAASTAIAGRDYVTFTSPELGDRDRALLSTLSSLYVLFERHGDLLRPLDLGSTNVLDDDLVTIQRYAGKTNELFTRLLMNVTLASCAFAGERFTRRFRLLDPMCGRGTTLNWALVSGFDVSGVEIDRKDFDAYHHFLKTYLTRKRLKHKLDMHSQGPGKKGVRHLHASFAPTKEQYKAGDTIAVDVYNDDTLNIADRFRAGSFDVIVTDAPYGVQHGSHEGQRGLSRSPLDLVRDALPAWQRVLRPGGALGMSWNTLVASRERVVEIFEGAGLEVLGGEAYSRFGHRVDQAIVRDIIVARKSS